MQIVVHRRRLPWLFPRVLAGVLFAMCSGCNGDKVLEEWAKELQGESVVVGSSDSTAPSVLLRFIDPNTNTRIDIKSGDPNKTVSVKASEKVLVTAIAEDPQGVQEIKLCSDGQWRCLNGQIGQVMQPNYPCSTSTSQATPGTTATTKRWLSDAVTPTSCSQGWQFVEGHRSFYATAKNFSGMAASSPTLVFQKTP